jgi:hypothetical protein
MTAHPTSNRIDRAQRGRKMVIAPPRSLQRGELALLPIGAATVARGHKILSERA